MQVPCKLKFIGQKKYVEILQKELKKLDHQQSSHYVYNLLKYIIIYTPIKLLLFESKSKFPVVKMLCSDILRFADLLLENKVRVNGINLFELARV